MCAIPTGAGPYNWGDYLATGGGRVDARSSALECDQTWVVETPRTASPFYPGVSEYNDFWQIWTGERVTVNGTNFRVMKGNVVFENEVVSQTSDNFIGYVGPAKLLLRNGGSLHASADDIKIGTAYNNGTDGTATVFMEEPSTLSAASGKRIYVGNNLPGALWMDGGLVAMTNAPFFSGTSSGDGYVRVNGGKIHLRETSDTPALIVGGVSYSSMHVSGGEVTASRSSVSSSLSQVGTGPSPAAELYADGGVLDFVNERFCVGQWGSVAGTSALTIDGTAEMMVNLLVMGNSDKAGTAIANFNGGKIKITRGLANYGKTLPTRQLNFDGGTVEGALDMAWPTTVYPGGGTINVPSGSSYAQTFLPRMATGHGVDAITLTNPGSGYVTAPRVTITGGSGSGASAYAVLAKDRTIERIVVTCRGEGYAEADELTVTIASTTGSGAAATATLAANGGGALRKTGPGTWTHKANASFDGTIEVKGGAINADGATLNVNKVAMRNGVGYLGATGNTAAGTIAIGTLDVDCGLAIVNSTNKFALTLADETLASASAGGSRIVNGLVYKNGDASAYRSPSLFERAADGSLSLITTTSTIGPDANYSPSGSFTEANAPTVTSFNCVVLPLSPAVDCYVRSADKVEIKSGMIVYRRPQPDLQRFSVTGGGALTTRAPGGMFIYGDSYEPAGRSHSQANGNAVFFTNSRRRIFGPFADPDASTPMTITIAGEKQGRPEVGAIAWLLSDDAYSGGLNLVNGGIVYKTERNLGGATAPIRAAGNCSITARETIGLSATRTITIEDEGALIFSPANDSRGNTVASALAGNGALLTSDVNRSGCAIAYTGDHTAFTGDYYIQGHARIAPGTFSAAARICLADGENGGVGVIETSGTIDRAPGAVKGGICWRTHDAYKTLGYGLRGGFAAKGGSLNVNLGGDARKLAVGSEYLPDGAVVQLQSQHADGELTLANGFELGGKTQRVNVWSGKTATIGGNVSDAVGGGKLDVTGNVAFAGTLEVGEMNLEGEAMLAVDGALDLTGAKVAIDADKESLAEFKANGLVLATATGAITGAPTFVTPPAGSWTLRVKDGALLMKASLGTVITLR